MPDDVATERRSAWPVVLLSMPFIDPYRPSIQLGLLKAVTERRGFPVRTYHAYLDFAVQIGVDYYKLLCQHRGTLIGDWLFSLEAFGDTAPIPMRVCSMRLPTAMSYLGDRLKTREKSLSGYAAMDVPIYLDGLVDNLPWDEVAVAGFSSTFQQSAASFALARRLKHCYPRIITVFGGANFDSEMGPELVRAVDCIDAAIIGEGDTAFPACLTPLAAGGSLDHVPGVSPAGRASGHGRRHATPPADQLDDLPAPDYDEYFQRAEDLGVLPRTGLRNVLASDRDRAGDAGGEPSITARSAGSTGQRCGSAPSRPNASSTSSPSRREDTAASISRRSTTSSIWPTSRNCFPCSPPVRRAMKSSTK